MKGRFEPEITITEKNEDSVILHMKNMPQEYANGIRRALHAEAPTVTLDKIQFIANNTSLTEEMIAQRLGMIPIVVNTERFRALKYFFQCDNVKQHDVDITSMPAKYCSQCMVYCELNVENNTSELLTVKDSDIIFQDDANYRPFSVAHNCDPVPIVKLGYKQKLHFKALAMKGKGRIHAKWSPVCACPLTPVIQLNLDHINMLLEEPQTRPKTLAYLQSVCCKNVFQVAQNQLVRVDAELCIACDDCHRVPLEIPYVGKDMGYPFVCEGGMIKLQQPIDINSVPFEYNLQIESAGAQPPKEILLNALEELNIALNNITQYEGYARIEDVENVENVGADADFLG